MIDTLHFISNGNVSGRHKIAAKHSIEAWLDAMPFYDAQIDRNPIQI